MWPIPRLRRTWQVGASWRILFTQVGSSPPSPLGGKEAGEAQDSKRFAQGAELEPEPKFELARSSHLGHALCYRAHSPADMEVAGCAPYKTPPGIPNKDFDPATAPGPLVPLLSVIWASKSGWSRRPRRAEGGQGPEFSNGHSLTSPRHPTLFSCEPWESDSPSWAATIWKQLV